MRHPEKTDMVVFRENTEDIYAGIEWASGSEPVRKVIDFLQREMGVEKIRFPETSAIGIKPMSSEGSERLIRAARFAAGIGLKVNAGHGIDYENIQGILRVPHLCELNIGHSIVGRAIMVGMERAVREMIALMGAYQGGER